MKLRIVVSYVPRYQHGHEWDFVPPVTGIHLAALAGSEHTVEVVHEQVRTPPVDDWPELVAISFFSGFAARAYALADAYRALGIPVVLGGPHASYWIDEALAHADAVVVGEAESVWQQLLADFEQGRVTGPRVYRGEARALAGLPTPRYDLLEPRFVVPRVIQATRGCPFSCSFCSVPDLNPGFRVRPVEDVVRDLESSRFPGFFQDKVAWFWDDNLLVQRRWAKTLLGEMRGLNKWWLTQASIDIVRDPELLRAMERSGCIGIFLGIESLDAAALQSVDKRQNRIAEYRDAVARLHGHGICVMAGFISGFDTQTPEEIVAVAERLDALEFDVPFLSILTPFRGTPLYDELLREGRLLEERSWAHYNGYNVAFRPRRMTPEALLAAHRELWRRAFAPAAVAARIARGARQLRAGGLMLSASMNGFYGLKRLTGNLPAEARDQPDTPRIAHPAPSSDPARISLRIARPAPTRELASGEQ
jgi:radical SAM superfamily enzyme YgiQ (UPF0313 family)